MSLDGALCVGKSRLFDSIRVHDHYQASLLCAECPVIAACREVRDKARTGSGYAQTSLVGTWAGKLYGAPAGAVALAREEAMFTDEEARAAHSAFVQGQRSTRVRTGERIYQRRAWYRKTAAQTQDVA